MYILLLPAGSFSNSRLQTINELKKKEEAATVMSKSAPHVIRQRLTDDE